MSRARDSRAAAALAPRIKVYLANLDETREEFPGETIDATLSALPPTGFDAAVVKQGRQGCVIVESPGPVITDVPGFPLDVSSTIGSGDAFAGALAAALTTGIELIPAARTANAAAAAAFLLVGGDPLNPSLLDRQSDFLDGLMDN